MDNTLNQTLNWWKEVNADYASFFKNKTERAAQMWLLEHLGEQSLFKLIHYLPKLKTNQYAPIITTPYELRKKWEKVKTFFLRNPDWKQDFDKFAPEGVSVDKKYEKMRDELMEKIAPAEIKAEFLQDEQD